MTTSRTVWGLVVALAACKPAPPPAKPAAPSTSSSEVLVRIGTSSTDSSLRAFVPMLPAVDSGGECQVRRTSGSGATMVTAYFPSMPTNRNAITLTFDSVGHLVRYNDSRSSPGGVPRIDMPAGATAAQRDSAMRVMAMSRQTTTIGLNWPEDQANATNFGFGGAQPQFLSGTVRALENLEKLGPPTARIVRVRKLCGV